MAERIRDRYEPLQVVGAGGQSTVLRALDHGTGGHVALKVRPRGLAGSEDSLLHEARVLLGLDPHPLLCRVLDHFFAGDRYYLVTEWVEGTTLADVLARAGGHGLPLAEAVHYLSQVATALDHLHRHRPLIVHGDVKPANIIVTPDGKAVLVDFGISRVAGRTATAVSSAAGTAGYAAPEMVHGEPLSPAADVFSLAATAFALVTGRSPRPGSRPTWSGLDDERARLVEFALRRGLSLDPTRRPATAIALVGALQGQLGSRSHLPPQGTPFVEREAEMARVKGLLATTRLLTLGGAGGLGKTRLAVQAVADLASDFPDGAFFVALAPLPAPQFLAPLVLAALDAGYDAGEPPADAVTALVARLERRNVLLLLDGCEHARAACRDLARTILDACPHVRVLATSRVPLGCRGEVVHAVSTLSTPDPFRLPPLDDLDGYEAVRLFVDRAAAVAPAFDIRAADVPGLAQLCRRLDGVPLAVQLAAGQVGRASLQQIVLEVAERLPLFGSERQEAAVQERTVQATAAWAYGNLDRRQQAAFDRLSVFAGGFPAEGARAVGVERGALSALAQRSLVNANGTRWVLHDTLRQYGAAKLAETDLDDEVRSRHAEWAMGMVDAGLPQAEQLNVMAAFRWAARPGVQATQAGQHRSDVARHLAAGLERSWARHFSGSRSWLQAALTAG